MKSSLTRSTTLLGTVALPPVVLRPYLLLTRSIRYSDNEYEYRHVQLPKAMLKAIPKDYHDQNKGTLKLLWEDEWRAIGITQVGYTNTSH